MRRHNLFRLAASAIAALALLALNCIAWIACMILTVLVTLTMQTGPWVAAVLSGIPWLALFMSVARWSAWRGMVMDALRQLHNLLHKTRARNRGTTL
jgi:hypothetical protein